MNAFAEYRRNLIAGKTGVGLVVVLYDALISALYQAASAMRAGEIEARSRHVDRALRILGHLQSTLDVNAGGEVAICLERYYGSTVSEILRACATVDPSILDAQIAHAASIAEAWREIEKRAGK